MKTFKSFIVEGRPSQRHPLEGHEYHRKTDAELVYIAKDAHKAAEAMKGHNTQAENKYRDQANDSATVRYYRQKNGMPNWYKKKYGHIKEGRCWPGYKPVPGKKAYEPGSCVKEEVELDESIPKTTNYALIHSSSKKIIAKGNKAEMMKKMKELNAKEKNSHHLGMTNRGKVGDTFGEEVELDEDTPAWHFCLRVVSGTARPPFCALSIFLCEETSSEVLTIIIAVS